MSSVALECLYGCCLDHGIYSRLLAIVEFGCSFNVNIGKSSGCMTSGTFKMTHELQITHRIVTELRGPSGLRDMASYDFVIPPYGHVRLHVSMK